MVGFEDEAEAVGADACPRVQDDAVADAAAAGNPRSGVQAAVFSDLRPRPQECAGADDRAAPDRSPAFDHGMRADGNALGNFRRAAHRGSGMNAGRSRRLGAQRPQGARERIAGPPRADQRAAGRNGVGADDDASRRGVRQGRGAGAAFPKRKVAGPGAVERTAGSHFAVEVAFRLAADQFRYGPNLHPRPRYHLTKRCFFDSPHGERPPAACSLPPCSSAGAQAPKRGANSGTGSSPNSRKRTSTTTWSAGWNCFSAGSEAGRFRNLGGRRGGRAAGNRSVAFDYCAAERAARGLRTRLPARRLRARQAARLRRHRAAGHQAQKASKSTPSRCWSA